jgi:hypothetical protein
MKIYVDGQIICSRDISTEMVPNSHPVLIGKHVAEHGEQMYSDGIIDEVRIYDRALSEEEIEYML